MASGGPVHYAETFTPRDLSADAATHRDVLPATVASDRRPRVSTEEFGMTLPQTRSAARNQNRQRAARTKGFIALVCCTVLLIGAAVAVLVVKPWVTGPTLHPTSTVRYLGLYQPGVPDSYTGIDQFSQAIGRQPNLVSYYSDWEVPFRVRFADSAAGHGAVTLVQIDPVGISLANIAAGRYDNYLRRYAAQVKAFRSKVILSFGHEMNGKWYAWGYTHTPAKVFVAAWRHMVDVFRSVGATNVIWLWTVNIIASSPVIPNPGPWWPGSAYVNWVGIDGYYLLPTWSFASLFGPTISAVRALTLDPILIAETGAGAGSAQPAEITSLFDGIRAYGLYGFVWFNEDNEGRIWRVTSPASFAAFRQDAKEFMKPQATQGSGP
jgi:mannan endo-1,4-beta-mannosidase